MPNGLEFLDELALETHIKKMGDRELSEFTARQIYDVCNLTRSNERRIVTLEKRGNKLIGLVGSLGALLGAAFMAAIEYLIRRG